MKKDVVGWEFNDYDGLFNPICEDMKRDITVEIPFGDTGTMLEVSWSDYMGDVVSKRIPMEVFAEFLRHAGYKVEK